MAEPTTGAIAGFVALGVGLLKILDIIISALLKKLLPEKGLTEDEQHRLEQIHVWVSQMHALQAKTDSDGVPLMYMPRAWAEQQAKILDTVQQVSNTQEKLGDTLKRCVVILDRIDRRQHT